jgi:hypothetical protein
VFFIKVAYFLAASLRQSQKNQPALYRRRHYFLSKMGHNLKWKLRIQRLFSEFCVPIHPTVSVFH